MLNLKHKADFVYKQTLILHKLCQGVRIASSLSPIELLVALYYGGLIKYNPNNPFDEDRDRVIISKGHGSICMYPILADLGFFDKKDLRTIGKEGSFLGSIPEPSVPGYETINGSLGHGLGVGCGIAHALKKQGKNNKVIVLSGDGELEEGSMWEAIMFAGHHHINNLILIIDHNKASMLDFSKNVIDLDPMRDKFKAFNWEICEVENAHDIEAVYKNLKAFVDLESKSPKVVIAHTIKGNKIKSLEQSPISHILSVSPEEIDNIIKGLDNE